MKRTDTDIMVFNTIWITAFGLLGLFSLCSIPYAIISNAITWKQVTGLFICLVTSIIIVYINGMELKRILKNSKNNINQPTKN